MTGIETLSLALELKNAEEQIEQLQVSYKSLEQQIKRGDLRAWMTAKNAEIEQLQAENKKLYDHLFLVHFCNCDIGVDQNG